MGPIYKIKHLILIIERTEVYHWISVLFSSPAKYANLIVDLLIKGAKNKKKNLNRKDGQCGALHNFGSFLLPLNFVCIQIDGL